ncbi:MAG: DUF2868 domain-containing protein [Planctomycetota bacterium]
MDLSQLLDFEVRLHRDGDAMHGDGATLEARDATAGAHALSALGRDPNEVAEALTHDRGLRERLAGLWLEHVRDASSDGGSARSLRLAGAVVTGVALLLGAGAASGALQYDGKHPVNVFWFLLGLVVTQIALLALLLWAIMHGKRGLLGAAVAGLARTRWLRGSVAGTLGAVSARLDLHAAAERWYTFAVAQRAAVAFNAGALATCLALVSFTDLAFGWSTTLQVGAGQVHTACRVIAAPWAWLLPDALPSLHLVEASQWVRMPGAFVGGGSLAEAVSRSGAWWSFLVVALLVWGLCPRLLAWGIGAWRTRRALASVPFDDHRCRALFARMLQQGSHWHSPGPATVGLAPDARAAACDPGTATTRVARAATWLLCWGRLGQTRDELARRVAAATGQPPLGVLEVGGSRLAADDEATRTLAQAGAQRVLLALAVGSQPTKEVLDLLRALRQRLGARAHLGVALVGDDPATRMADDELSGWRVSLDRMADPYLGLERLEAKA